MKIWGMIPARGGSKSIPYKNLVPLNSVPLMDYGILAAQKSGIFDRLICSTEDEKIASHASGLGIEVDIRPDELATDASAVEPVAIEMLERLSFHSDTPDILVLIQPTSPFLLPEHVTLLVQAMERHPEAASGQTVAKCPHNHHAWNQRIVEDVYARFYYADEHKAAYNKQRKKKFYVFGNLVAVKPENLKGNGFFTEPSVSVEIPRPYDFDLDGPDDLLIAEAIVQSGLVSLRHIKT